jgi:hypothetical protein
MPTVRERLQIAVLLSSLLEELNIPVKSAIKGRCRLKSNQISFVYRSGEGRCACGDEQQPINAVSSYFRQSSGLAPSGESCPGWLGYMICRCDAARSFFRTIGLLNFDGVIGET